MSSYNYACARVHVLSLLFSVLMNAYSVSKQVCNIYSEISNSGRSEIGTISLQRTRLEVPRYFSHSFNTFWTSPKRITSLQRTRKLSQSVLYLEIPLN